MKILIICFFSLFFLSSIIGIVMKLLSFILRDDKVKVELYDNGKLNKLTDFSHKIGLYR